MVQSMRSRARALGTIAARRRVTFGWTPACRGAYADYDTVADLLDRWPGPSAPSPPRTCDHDNFVKPFA
jgi:hypothetical protein